MFLTSVHTTGVNWESIGTIVGAISAVVGTLGHYVGKKIDTHRNQTVGHIERVATQLTGRLDGFDSHLHKQDATLLTVRERLARLEGPIWQTNQAVNSATPGDPSIRQNIETLVERKDMDPEATS